MEKILLLLICIASTFLSKAQTKVPIYILNGKPTTSYIIRILNVQNIKSIAILKDKHARKKYGAKSVDDAVIELTTKSNTDLYKYRSILDRFHLPHSDKNLPAFLDVYLIKNARHYYWPLNTIASVKEEVVDGRKIVRISSKLPINDYMTIMTPYIVNGQFLDKISLNLIDPATIASIAYLDAGALRELYGNKNNIKTDGYAIYLKNGTQLYNMPSFFDKYKIPEKYRQWPMFKYGTDDYWNPRDSILATLNGIDSILVNRALLRIEIQPHIFPPNEKSLSEKIQAKRRERPRNMNEPIIICSISRTSFFQQYVKNNLP